jgi:hypothetical protein
MDLAGTLEELLSGGKRFDTQSDRSKEALERLTCILVVINYDDRRLRNC